MKTQIRATLKTKLAKAMDQLLEDVKRFRKQRRVRWPLCWIPKDYIQGVNGDCGKLTRLRSYKRRSTLPHYPVGKKTPRSRLPTASQLRQKSNSYHTCIHTPTPHQREWNTISKVTHERQIIHLTWLRIKTTSRRGQSTSIRTPITRKWNRHTQYRPRNIRSTPHTDVKIDP